MVRGSGRDPEDSEKAKSSYDGSVAKWPAGSMKLKSSLYKAGLWNVVKHGPTPKSSPVEAPARAVVAQAPTPDPSATWYFAKRDNVVHGPFTSRQLLDEVNIIEQTDGDDFSGDSVWLYHHLVTGTSARVSERTCP